MNNELLNNTIRITDVSIEDKRIKINDENGKVYSIWTIKKDGNKTQAYQSFEPYALSAVASAMLWDISYDEKPNPQNIGTFFRTIKKIVPSTAKTTDSNTLTDAAISQPIGGNQELMKAMRQLWNKLDNVDKSMELIKSYIIGKQQFKENIPIEDGESDYINVEDIPF